MKTSDLVSIIIPVHNSEKYLDKCLNSIINQTYKNIEIITIENGSTDKSLEILKSFEPKIKVITLNESGISPARNKGIELSTGKYIAFLDSDDTVENTFIEDLINNLKENQSDLSICNINEIHEETNKTILRNEYPQNNITKEIALNNLEKFNYAVWNKLYKRELIVNNNIKFPNLKYEDVPFTLAYLSICNKISKVNKYLYNYLIHKQSEQTTVNNKVFDIIEIMNICKNYATKENLEDLYVYSLTTYALKMRYVKDKNLRKSFIDKSYEELNKTYKNWRNSHYIKTRNIIKRIIQKHKILVKIYTTLYPKD